MEENNLGKLLDELHHEIQNVDSIDEKGQALLRDLDADIRQLLERSEKSANGINETTLSHLGDTIRYFEVTHPTITATLSKLMSILSNAGI